jgi:hypothetical protein
MLSIRGSQLKTLVDEVEKIRGQLREAKAAGRSVNTTEVPGPYWGLEF